jgi:uncharacterized protein (TIGR03435 family)
MGSRAGELLLIGAAAGGFLIAQKQSPPKFEVASVKPSLPGAEASTRTHISAGRITLENYPLRSLVQAAYGLRSFELSGAPAWIDGARYDIIGKAAKPANAPELWTMIQSVLTDRFNLKMHREQKEFPVYNLSIARRDKLPDPRDGSCTGSDPTAPPQQPAPGKRLVAPCGSILMPGVPGGAELYGGRVRMTALAQRLTDIVGRPVIDKTGFGGTFDLRVKFAFDGFGRPVASDPDLSALPAIFTALRDQLGLKLESGKAMLAVVVIDSIERPSANRMS